MDINRHNYEAYLLDLLEGSLSVDEQQELQNFLLLNPDCGSELREMEPWILEGEKVSYENSQLLKKEFPNSSTILGNHNFDLFSIARMEGDLNADQIEAHQTMLEADELIAQQWDDWQRTKVAPVTLEFEGKDRLKRRNRLGSRILALSVISAAAAIALLFILFRTGPDPSQQESYSQTQQEVVSNQNFDEPVIAEARADIVETGQNQRAQTTPDPPVRKFKDPVPVSNNIDHGRVSDGVLKIEDVPRDDIKPQVLAQVGQQLSGSIRAGEAVPDKIEPLYIPPVPIHMSSLSVAQISELDLQEVIEDYTEEKDFSLLKVANAGIKGINKVAGSDISLMASRDDEGEVSGFQLKSKRFSFTRPLGRED